MFFGTNGCMYSCGDSCTGQCREPIKPMGKKQSKKQNAKILTDLLEYLKEGHSYLPSHVFEVLDEVIYNLKR
jgi:hypothetical protein